MNFTSRALAFKLGSTVMRMVVEEGIAKDNAELRDVAAGIPKIMNERSDGVIIQLLIRSDELTWCYRLGKRLITLACARDKVPEARGDVEEAARNVRIPIYLVKEVLASSGDHTLSDSSLLDLAFDTESQIAQYLDNPLHAVFLVHGHDTALLEMTARFLEKLNLAAVVLHEQPGMGRTIIEKLEDHSDVDFAVVLLTPDDMGRSRVSQGEQPRARQNVIMELGYFLGKLGRNRVCALYVEGVEIPSDYSGVCFVAVDKSGGWKWKLASELKAAGSPIDLNQVAGL